jgi:hypothetical protein
VHRCIAASWHRCIAASLHRGISIAASASASRITDRCIKLQVRRRHRGTASQHRASLHRCIVASLHRCIAGHRSQIGIAASHHSIAASASLHRISYIVYRISRITTAASRHTASRITASLHRNAASLHRRIASIAARICIASLIAVASHGIGLHRHRCIVDRHAEWHVHRWHRCIAASLHRCTPDASQHRCIAASHRSIAGIGIAARIHRSTLHRASLHRGTASVSYNCASARRRFIASIAASRIVLSRITHRCITDALSRNERCESHRRSRIAASPASLHRKRW